MGAKRHIRRRLVFSAIALIVFAVWTAPASAQRCAGDCNNDRFVSIDELVLCLNVGLGLMNIPVCINCSVDTNTDVDIRDLVRAVDAATRGCPTPLPTFPPGVTPTATPTVPPTATETPIPATNTPVHTQTATPPAPTETPVATETSTVPPTPTDTPIPATNTPVHTATATLPVPTGTPVATATTLVPPSPTMTEMPTQTSTATIQAPTETPSTTATATGVPTQTASATVQVSTATATPEATETDTPTPTATGTAEPAAIFQGALTRTNGRFTYQATVGIDGADAECNAQFAGAHACTIDELRAAETAGELIGATDTDGMSVTSFWAIDPSRPDADQCTVSVAWDYATAHTGQFADLVNLNGETGALSELQEDAICATQHWVGCCL